jgi:hypothetical protein
MSVAIKVLLGIVALNVLFVLTAMFLSLVNGLRRRFGQRKG